MKNILNKLDRVKHLFQKKSVSSVFTATAILILAILLLFYRTVGSEARDGARKVSVQGELPENFNHDATSFPLVGAHRQLQCSQCHLGGKYKGLPTTCENCHNGQMADGKPQNHVMTTQSCNVCHAVLAWSPATFRHDLAMVTGQCSTCHNGQQATGKSQNHIMTTQQCDTCHKVTAWIPAGFQHDLAMVSGRCSTCHNGQQATGKSQNHIMTTQECDSCHRVTAWTPSMMTNHPNPKLIGAHSVLDCKVCHTQSIPTAFFRDGTQFGFCANCHTRDYTFPGPGAHKNNPVTKTPFASMQDSLRVNAMCSQCHKHADYRQF